MFGIDTKKLKTAFVQFKSDTAALAPSPDPVTQAIVKFISTLSQAFD